MNFREVGKKYETAVADFLEKYQYHIIKRNFYCRSGEIDLIAIHGENIVFIEVKYRKDEKMGWPEDAVSIKKQKSISKAACCFMQRYPQYCGYQVRFDVAAVLGRKIRIYPNAFEYQWRL